jgi:transcriptional regulator
MYLPSHFEETRVDVLHRLIEERPLGTLVTRTPDGLEANHLPFEIDRQPPPFGTLRGHVARANPQWRSAAPGVEALVIFHGPDGYVSPGLYPSKRETGQVVPTWNYVVAHAVGPLRVVDDPAWLRGLVGRLTDRHERGRREPWKLGDAPADFIDAMLRAIVGLEMPILRLTGKWKLSQNRPPGDRAGVAEGLEREPRATGPDLAERVREAASRGLPR